ncbi:hypothetical protein MMPV_002686 [Pyropia vietnamensis]
MTSAFAVPPLPAATVATAATAAAVAAPPPFPSLVVGRRRRCCQRRWPSVAAAAAVSSTRLWRVRTVTETAAAASPVVRLPASDPDGEPIGWWSPSPPAPPAPSTPIFYLRKVVSPQDSDYSGALWHGAYVRYLEEARVGLLAALGVPYNQLVGGEGVELVVASLAITYVSPARLGEAVTVSVRAQAGGRVRVGLESEVVAAATGRLVARATVVLAPVRMADGRLVRELPSRLAGALGLFRGTWDELMAAVAGGGDGDESRDG